MNMTQPQQINPTRHQSRAKGIRWLCRRMLCQSWFPSCLTWINPNKPMSCLSSVLVPAMLSWRRRSSCNSLVYIGNPPKLRDNALNLPNSGWRNDAKTNWLRRIPVRYLNSLAMLEAQGRARPRLAIRPCGADKRFSPIWPQSEGFEASSDGASCIFHDKLHGLCE